MPDNLVPEKDELLTNDNDEDVDMGVSSDDESDWRWCLVKDVLDLPTVFPFLRFNFKTFIAKHRNSRIFYDYFSLLFQARYKIFKYFSF